MTPCISACWVEVLNSRVIKVVGHPQGCQSTDLWVQQHQTDRQCVQHTTHMYGLAWLPWVTSRLQAQHNHHQQETPVPQGSHMMQRHPTAQQVVRAGPCGQHKTLKHRCREHAANNSCSRVETQPTASCKPPSTVGQQAGTAGEPMQASETSVKLPTTPTPPHNARNKLLNHPQERRAQVRHRSNTPGTTRCILSSCQYTITGGTAGHTGGPHGSPSACPAHNILGLCWHRWCAVQRIHKLG